MTPKRLYKRILKDLPDVSIELAWMAGKRGHLSGDTVTVNPAYDIADTIIHEMLHRIYPEWDEAQVLTATGNIMDILTDAEVGEIVAWCPGIDWTG